MKRFIVVLVITSLVLSAGMMKADFVYAGDAVQGALIGAGVGALIGSIQYMSNKSEEQKENKQQEKMKEKKSQETCQAKDLVIKLNDIKVDISDVNFYIEDVIDSRANKDDIGIAMVGIFNKKIPVQLEGGLKESLLKSFSYSLPQLDNKIPIVVNILRLQVGEKTEFSGEYAEAEIEMEFCLKKGDKIGQIYQARSFTKTRSFLDVTPYHEANIRKVLSNCLKSFVTHKWNEDNVTLKDMDIFKNEMKEKAVQEVKERTEQIDTFNKKKGHSKMYIGIGLPYQSVKGDLNGEGILTNPKGEILLVPKLQSDVGTEIIWGTRYPTDSGKNSIEQVIEMSYTWTNHSAEWMGTYRDASHKVFSFNYRPHFHTDKKTQPFLNLGFSLCTLEVKNGASSGTKVGDATFRGYRFNIGGGFSRSLSKYILLNGSLIYNFGAYTTAKGVGGEFGKIQDELKVNGLNPILRLEYLF